MTRWRAVMDELYRTTIDDAEIDQMIGALRNRIDDKLCLDAADVIEGYAKASAVTSNERNG